MLWLLEQIDTLPYDSVMALLPNISPERRERVMKLRDRSAQIQSVMAHLLLCYAMKKECGRENLPVIAYSETGKPFFSEDMGIFFNLSHCEKAVACAVDASPIGVDVQETGCLRRNKSSAVPARKPQPSAASLEEQTETKDEIRSLLWVLAETERAWVLAGRTPDERERRFITVWTFKEAYGKTSGAGILYKTEQFDFMPCIEGGSSFGFSFQSFPRRDAVLTLCSKAPLELRVVSLRDVIVNVLEGPR